MTPSPDISSSYPFLNRPHIGVMPRVAAGVTPLSWQQEQIWLHGMLFAEWPLYTETISIQYHGALQVPALERALEGLIQRHGILRTTIVEQDGVPRQVTGAVKQVKVEVFDVSEEPEDEREHRVDGLLSEFARRFFDLEQGPLYRVIAVKVHADDTRIFLSLHHTIFDGVSLRQILLPELIELYGAYSTGRNSALAPPQMQYASYAYTQKLIAAQPRPAAMAFWQNKLANFSVLNLPYDRPRKAQTGRRGAVHHFNFDDALAEAVLEMTRRERTTTFLVLLASFILMLARSSGTEDVTLGTTYGGRASTELEGVVGCFLNTLLLRTDLSGDPSFRELMKRAWEVTLDAVENADVPFQQVVRQALPRINIGDSPVQAFFSFQPPAPALSNEWEMDVFRAFNGAAKFDLHVEVEQAQGAFRGRIMYATDLFDAETIEGMTQHWIDLTRSATLAPETCVWKLPPLEAQERKQVLTTAEAGEAETPQRIMNHTFGSLCRRISHRLMALFRAAPSIL